MFQSDLDYLAHKERVREFRREAEQAQLISGTQSQAEGRGSHVRVIDWIGHQMIKWGTKLKEF